MAITSLATLKTAVQERRDRTDAAFTNRLDEFVSLCEKRIIRKAGNVRTSKVADATLTATIDSRDIALPSDFLEPYSLFLTTFGSQDAMAPIVGGNYELSLVSGTPEAWLINGANISLDKPADQAHSFVFWYRKKLFDLATTDPNWMLTNHEDVYLWGCLREACIFENDNDGVLKYETLFREALRDVNWLEGRSKSIAPLRVDAGLASVGGFNINSGDHGGVR